MTHNRAVRVSGVPGGRHGDDLILDKLLLHFLRRKNGGDGEVEVSYPTEERGVAMLTFDLVEVADRVLSRRHKLEIEGFTYLLEVSRPKRRGTQLSMPITTTMSLEYFTDMSEVRRLLEKHNLKVYGEGKASLQINGDFQDLSRCRDELYKTMINPYFSGQCQTENQTSHRGRDVTDECSPGRVSREETRMQKSNGRQSPVTSLPDTASNKISSRNASPIRGRRTSESLPADNEGYASTRDKNKPPYIKPSLTHNEASQRRAKDTSSNDLTSTKKHPRTIAANLNYSLLPPKKESSEEDKRPDINSLLANSGKPADSSGLASHTALTSTQFGEDLPKSRQPKNAFATDSISSQSKTKGTIGDELTSNPKNPNSTIGESVNSKSRQPKDTSTDDFSTSRKVHLGPHKETFADQDRREDRNSPEASDRKPFESSGLARVHPGQPRNTSTDHITANLNVRLGPNKETFADQDRREDRDSPLAIERKPSKSLGLTSDTTFTIKQYADDHLESRQPNATHSTDSSSSQSQHKDTIADEFTPNPKHSNSTTGDRSNINPGQPKNTSNDNTATSLNVRTFVDKARRQDRNSPEPSDGKPSEISGLANINLGKPKNTSADHIVTNLNVHPRSLKETFDDKNGRQDRNPPLANDKEPSWSSGLANVNPGQPKNTSADHIVTNLNVKETFVDMDRRQNRNSPLDSDRKPSGKSGFHNVNPGQPNNTSIDHITPNLNVHRGPHKETFDHKNRRQDRNSPEASDRKPSGISGLANVHSGHPRNTSADELHSNPKLPKNSTRNSANPGKHKNPEDITSIPRTQQDLSASSAHGSSPMVAGWSSSDSPTMDPSAASHSGNHRAQSPLSTEILVDPAAHTYFSVFMKDKINDILGQCNVEMRTETCEGYNRVILTARSPHLSQLFYKAAHEISDIFVKFQQLLRVQSIDLTNISADVTRKLRLYLHHCGIWTMADQRRLQMIGPSNDILGFMEKWTSAKGDFGRFVYLAQEGAGSARPPAVGMDHVNPSPAPSHSATHEAQIRRVRPREESGSRRGRGREDTKTRPHWK